MHLKRISLGLAAIILSTSTVLASSVSVPLGCQNGTRSEPQPDIPGYVIPGDPAVIGTVGYKDNPGRSGWHAGRDVCVYPNGNRNLSYQPDCLTMWDTKSMADTKSSIKGVIKAATPDIVVDPVPQPDLIIPTKTVKIKTVTVSPTRPFVTVTHSYETSDGTCR